MSEKYPKSGLYREHKAEVQEYAKERYERFTHNLDGELQRMFGKNINLETVTEEQRESICLIAKYALQRLVGGALYSKYHDGPGTLGEAVDHVIREDDVGHDIMHAMVAGMMNENRSHVPVYATTSANGMVDRKVHSYEQLEEAYVGLFEHMTSLASSLKEMVGNPQKLEQGLKDARISFHERQELRRLAKKNPGLFFMQYWEKTDFIGGSPAQSSFRAAHRAPAIAEVMSHLYEHTKNGALNPNFPLTEFLRIHEPLVTRLRAKPNASE